jgi:predicted ATP-grasp superfamily ATP-dependent carboligase
MSKVLVAYSDAAIGLTVVRALGAAGVSVDGLIFGGGRFADWSKYLKGKVRLRTHAELTAEKFHEVLEAFGPEYIMAVGEKEMVRLNGLRASLPSGVKMLFPDEPVFRQALMKPLTLQIARRLGIDCPKTFGSDENDDLDEFLGSVLYPVVMKFPYSRPEAVPELLRMKYWYAHTPDEVRSLMDLYGRYGVRLLIQEYVAGQGVGVELCMHRGDVAGVFQHERIHELPLAGGASTYCRGMALDQDLFERSVLLLREMGWEGVAMVEFRRDPKTGRTALMEVNGRFWGSLFLAVASGVNFPHILLRTMGEGETVAPPPYKVGVRGKREGRELSWALDAAILRWDLPPEGFRSRLGCLWDYLKTCSPRVKRDIWSWKDIMPGLCFRLGLLPALAFAFVKWARQRLRAGRP